MGSFIKPDAVQLYPKVDLKVKKVHGKNLFLVLEIIYGCKKMMLVSSYSSWYHTTPPVVSQFLVSDPDPDLKLPYESGRGLGQRFQITKIPQRKKMERRSFHNLDPLEHWCSCFYSLFLLRYTENYAAESFYLGLIRNAIFVGSSLSELSESPSNATEPLFSNITVNFMLYWKISCGKMGSDPSGNMHFFHL